MSEKTFPFEILTLQQMFLREEARFVIAPGQEGVFEILPDHAPFMFGLKPGALRIRTPVPGGVGPLTTTILMRNVVELFRVSCKL